MQTWEDFSYLLFLFDGCFPPYSDCTIIQLFLQHLLDYSLNSTKLRELL